MTKEVTIYQFNFDYSYPRILKKTFKFDNTDKVVEDESGFVQITLVDSYQNGHNGDWEDERECGYKTFAQAKKGLITRSKADFKKELDHIKSLKETK